MLLYVHIYTHGIVNMFYLLQKKYDSMSALVGEML